MTIRQLIFGKDNVGNVVFRAGKPGFDPLTANIGDLLVDNETQIYQVIASGTQFIQNCWEAYPTPLPPGWSPSGPSTVTRSISLGIGSFSRLALWFDLSINVIASSDIPVATLIEQIQRIIKLQANVVNGSLVFTASNIPYYNSNAYEDVRPQVNSNWFVFRSQF